MKTFQRTAERSAGLPRRAHTPQHVSDGARTSVVQHARRGLVVPLRAGAAHRRRREQLRQRGHRCAGTAVCSNKSENNLAAPPIRLQDVLKSGRVFKVGGPKSQFVSLLDLQWAPTRPGLGWGTHAVLAHS
eukprot:gene8202-biopygen4615